MPGGVARARSPRGRTILGTETNAGAPRSPPAAAARARVPESVACFQGSGSLKASLTSRSSRRWARRWSSSLTWARTATGSSTEAV